jgi:hypothetical protein
MVVGDGSDPAVRQRSDSGNQTDAVIPDTPDITDIPDDRPVKVIQLAQPLAQFDPIINRWPEGAAARRQGWQQDYAVLWGDWWGLTDPLMGWFGPWAELAWGAGFALHRARPFTAVAAAPGLQVNFLVAQQMAADLGIDLLWGDRVG